MKINKKYIVITFWVVLLVFLKSINVISFDITTIEKFLQTNEKYLIPIFILLWSVRIFVFVPGITFMVIGGIFFGPIEAIFLSTVGIFEVIVVFTKRKSCQLKVCVLEWKEARLINRPKMIGSTREKPIFIAASVSTRVTSHLWGFR